MNYTIWQWVVYTFVRIGALESLAVEDVCNDLLVLFGMRRI